MKNDSSMLTFVPVSYHSARGIPITGPFSRPEEANETMARISAQYPGEFFLLEDIESEHGLIVSWVPSACINYFVGQCMAHAVTGRNWEDQF